MMLKHGTRIRCLCMVNDPHPVPYGTLGTVKGWSEVGYGKDKFTQIDVNWDNGSELMLSVPPDEFTVVVDDAQGRKDDGK